MVAASVRGKMRSAILAPRASALAIVYAVCVVGVVAATDQQIQDASPSTNSTSSSSPSSSSLATSEASSSSSAGRPRAKRKSDYLTAYACEGSRLQINCSAGLFLDVIRANYGRFSIAICNDHGNIDWSVNCMSPRTTTVIKTRCANQNTCDVPVDSNIFGDPCPGTFKYVEVHYACRKDPVSAPATSPPPRPPWFPTDSSSKAWSAITSHMNAVGAGANATAAASEVVAAPASSVAEETATDSQPSVDDETEEKALHPSTPRVIEVRVPKPIDLGSIQRKQPNPHLPIPITLSTTTSRTASVPQPASASPASSTRGVAAKDNEVDVTADSSIQIMANFTQFCPPSSARGLFWNWTKAGDTAVLQCPSGSLGYAKWSCSPSSEWVSPAPSLAECKSLWLGDLESRLREGGDVANISHALAYYSATQSMYGSDIVLASRMIKHMAERMSYDIQRASTLQAREAMVTELMQNVARAASNLVDRAHHRSWADLDRDEAARAVTAILVGLEENAFLLAAAVTTEKIIIKPTDNILLSIRVMQARNVIRQRFPSVENLAAWGSSGALGASTIEVSPRALLQNGENGAVRIVFATFNQLEQLAAPSLAKDQHASATAGMFVNARMISASLSRGRHLELPEPAVITFRHLRTVNVSGPVCVYWDFSAHAWSNDGCKVAATNRTHTVCTCDHLTNFALLMREGESSTALASSPSTSATATSLSTGGSVSAHVSTIVASVAALVSISVIVFFLIIVWRRLRMWHQCRSALERSGLPCFHNSKDLADKDKANKGNFYTVTPKLNPNGTLGQRSQTGGPDDAPPEVGEEQQYFQHMISMQKNQDTLGLNKRKNSQAAAGGATDGQHQQETSLGGDEHVVRVHKQQCASVNDVHYPRVNGFARALSPYNHIYMEIDPSDAHLGQHHTEASLNGGGNGNVYEPLTHSETYMMSTLSDMSEDNNYAFGGTGCNYNSDMSRQSSSRESRPLLRSAQERNLLHTISGVLHSQSVRMAPASVAQQQQQQQQQQHVSSHTLNPMRRSMLVGARQQQQQQMDAQMFSGTKTIGRLGRGGEHHLQAGGLLPLVERLRQQQQPQQQVNSSTPTLDQLPENSILGRLAQESLLQQNQNQNGHHQSQLQPSTGETVQVMTHGGSQFVSLNLGNATMMRGQPGQAGQLGQQVTLMPGQVQAPVYSHQLVTSSAVSTPARQQQPQFAMPISIAR